ncbi:MAG: DUF1232 domain-containing protein [Coriobacteriia bacterium]|nr:DUF1232 domain-containing protein [Coriobacteriia bacterium]
MIQRLKRTARRLKRDTFALYLAARHRDTPWYAKAVAAGVAAYALSPIDLIPDFIPVLGYLDDLLLLPVGIALSIRLIPDHVLEECRARADEVFADGRPVSRAAAAAILSLWILGAFLLTVVLMRAWTTFG